MQLTRGDKRPLYETLYFVSLALLAGSLPLSKFTMSLFQFSTLFFWLWHGVDNTFLKNYPAFSLLNPLRLARFVGETIKNVFSALFKKFVLFFNNKPAIIIASLLFLHVVGLLYTTDFHYAMKDLRTKLPIFILPLFIATGPRINTRTLYLILACFIAAVFGGSIYRLILFLNLPVADSRALAAHTSHIRYSLNAVFAVFILFYFVYLNKGMNLFHKTAMLFIAIWLIGFMAYMNYLTGIVIFVVVSFLLLVYFIFRIKRILIKVLMLLAILLFIITPCVLIIKAGQLYVNTPEVDFTKLDKFTRNGNTYYHDTLNFKSSQGKWVGLYICEKELRQSWTQRSVKSLDSLDPKMQLTRFTLIRYLASKELRKDASGIDQLTDNDIHNIENGVNRFDYNKLPGPRQQIEDFIVSYQRYVNLNDPNSSSIMQRFEYWRTSLRIISKHPLIGVGTGDVPAAFEKQYIESGSNLAIQNRLRSHNQYLSIAVAFGILGLIWFLFVLIYPGVNTRRYSSYLYVVFWIIFMISMLTEDTIESQEGVTFYVLFTALLLFSSTETPPEKDSID